VQEIKTRKIHSFCLNMAVYRGSNSGGLVSQTDQLCLATSDKTLFYYEAYLSYNSQLNFKEEPNSDKGQFIGFKPDIMVWDDDKIYLSSKKGYFIMEKYSGKPLARYELTPVSRADPQMLTVCRGRCLVVTNNNRRAQFLSTTGG
jgi:hypothetical protein